MLVAWFQTLGAELQLAAKSMQRRAEGVNERMSSDELQQQWLGQASWPGSALQLPSQSKTDNQEPKLRRLAPLRDPVHGLRHVCVTCVSMAPFSYCQLS